MAKINKVLRYDHKVTTTIDNTKNKNLYKIAGGALLAAVVAGNAFGAPMEYKGDKTKLEDAESVFGTDLLTLLGIKDDDKGLIYKTNDKSVLTGADVIINYSESTAPKFVIGGYSDKGEKVKNNKITLKSGEINGQVYGGLSHYTRKNAENTGFVTNNINNSAVEVPINETAKTMQANSNTISVDASNAQIGTLTGGLANLNLITGSFISYRTYNYIILASSTTQANENTVEIENSVTTGDVMGGHASINIKTGNATSYRTLSDHDTYSYADSTGSVLSADNNKVIIGNGVNTGNVTGGHASINIKTGNALSNESNSYARADTNAITSGINLTNHNNVLTILKGSTVNGAVNGGYTSLHIKTGNATAGNVNTSDSYANAKNYALATNSALSASNNTVDIAQGSTINGRITGGQINLDITTGDAKSGKSSTNSSTSNNVANSSIDITNSTLQASFNKVKFDGTLNNTVNLDDTLASSNIIGGAINIELTTGSAKNYNGGSNNTNNTITTTGSKVEAKDNTVTLGEHAVINAHTSLYGGKMTGNYKNNAQYTLPELDLFSRNTLNMAARDINVKNVENFEKYQFTVYPELANTGTAQLTATNIIFGTNADNFKISGISSKKSTVTVVGVHSGKQLSKNDEFVLIHADSMSGSLEGIGSTGVAQQGISFLYDFKTTVNIANKKVIATVLDCRNDSHEACSIPPDENNGGSNNGGNETGGNDNGGNDNGNETGGNDNGGNNNGGNETGGNDNGGNDNGNETGGNDNGGNNNGGNETGGNDNGGSNNGGNETGGNDNGGSNNGGNETGGNDNGGSNNGGNETGGNDNGGNDTGENGSGEDGSDENGSDENGSDENGSDENGSDENNSSGESAARINPQLKALSEGRLSALTQITRGADVFAYDVFDVMRTQANAQQVSEGASPFVMISGSKTRYHSGSHIDTNDFLLAGGISYQNDHLQAAVFVEGGWSSYDTYSSFNNVANVHGKGHNQYVGTGVLGKYKFNNDFYIDASLRFGRSSNKFDTKDIQNLATGQYVQYSIKSPYISTHIGTGYEFEINQANTFDISVKYLWAHLWDKNVIITTDPIQFQSIDSQRLRIQHKLTHQYNKNLSMNAGLSYEYEFDGTARATTHQYYQIDAASVRGGTGIASFGLYAQPNEQSPLKIDLSAQGYAGKREGFAANLRFDYAF